MANQKRKPAKAKPITSNPLFPAVVALWFGALFGLGSLAVRPALLEALVLNSQIDLFIPAAAPPLGVTARILLALVMAALGAMLGIMLTHRLTQPEPEVYERKRGAKDLTAQSPRVRARDAHPDAPARRPISAHEELGGAPAVADDRAPASGPGMLANRRRALAIIHEEQHFVPHDHAPLPGGAVIQPLELAALVLPADSSLQPAPAQLHAASTLATAALDWSQGAPGAPAQLPPADPAKMNSLPSVGIAPVPAQAAHHDGRQVFGMAPPPPQAEALRQIFGVIAESDDLAQKIVIAAGSQNSVFDTPEPSPLFARTAPEPAVVTTEIAAAPVATSVEPLPSPAALGMTDLTARLAEAMRRRRALAQPPLAPAVAGPAKDTVQAAPAPAIPATALPAIPAAFVPPAAAEPAAAPVLAQFTAAAPAPAPAQTDFAAPRAMPAAMRPLALDAFLEDDAPSDSSLLPPRHFATPAPVAPSAEFSTPMAPVMVQPAAAQHDDEPADDERQTADSADNPYASLLGLAPLRPAFVRIDEPAAEAYEATEPVVIFPGQAPHIAPLVTAAPATSEDNGFRRFDAPASAGHGQPIAANSAAATVDPIEAAQALRTALNNLQRMSGAA